MEFIIERDLSVDERDADPVVSEQRRTPSPEHVHLLKHKGDNRKCMFNNYHLAPQKMTEDIKISSFFKIMT